MDSHLASSPAKAATKSSTQIFKKLTPKTVSGCLQAYGVEKYLTTDPHTWKAVEVGDGNLNFIFRVTAEETKGGEVCVKQAPPFIKVVPGFPLPQQRIGCEAEYLLEATRLIPGSVPRVLIWNDKTAKNGVLVMEWLSEMQILRHLLTQSAENVQRMKGFVGAQIGHYLAKMTFFTSELCLSSSEKKRHMSQYATRNHKMCQLQEEVVYTCPFQEKPSFPNNWLSPELDAVAKAVREDVDLRVAVGEVKRRFLNSAEMLSHGDLHTGSFMVSIDRKEVKVMDAEFAFYAPFGLDIGMVLGNLAFAFFAARGIQTEQSEAAPGSAKLEAEITSRQDGIMQIMQETWDTFVMEFATLWHDPNARKGPLYTDNMFQDLKSKTKTLKNLLARIFSEAMGFGACEMIRRVLGVDQNHETVTAIKDRSLRASAECDIVRCARWLVLGITGEAHPVTMATTLQKMRQMQVNPSKAPYTLRVGKELGTAGAVVLVAKVPRSGSSKTRLAPWLTPDGAAKFAEAMLSDLLQQLAQSRKLLHRRLVLFYSPATPAAETYLTDLIARIDGPKGLIATRWQLLPNTLSKDKADLTKPSLSALLKLALTRTRDTAPNKRQPTAVAFLGMDTPDMDGNTVSEALQHLCEGKAYVCPATDGGCTLIGVPSSVHPEVLDDVRWSVADNCISVISRFGLYNQVTKVGKTFADMDEKSDVLDLATRMTASEELRALCPHTSGFLRDNLKLID